MVPADGKLISSYRVSNQEITNEEYSTQLLGDIYGDSTISAKTTFEQSANIPNSQWWTEGDEVKLYNIHLHDNGILYVDFNTVDKSSQDKAIYSINGTKVGYDFDLLPKGIYIIGGKKVAK